MLLNEELAPEPWTLWEIPDPDSQSLQGEDRL